MENSNLKAFISYMEDNRNSTFTSSQWNRCIEDFQLSKDDITILKRLAHQHKDRADYLKDRNAWSEAIEELERATILSPPENAVLYQTALLYRAYYENESFLKEHRLKALNYLQMLEEDGRYKRHIAKQKKELRELQKILEPPPAKDNSLLFLFIPFLIALLLMVFSQRVEILDWITRTFNQPINDSIYEDITENLFPYGTRDLNIYGLDEDSYEMKIKNAEILSWNGKDAFQLQAKMTNINGNADQISLELNFLNEDSQTLDSKTLTYPSGLTPAPIQNETIAIDYFDYLVVNPAEIDSFSILFTQTGELPLSSGNAKDLPTQWESVKPEGLDLSVKLLNQQSVEGYDRLYYGLRLSLLNTGSKKIDHLDLKILGLNPDYEDFLHKEWTIINTSNSLSPGEAKPLQIMIPVNHKKNEPLEAWNILFRTPPL